MIDDNYINSAIKLEYQYPNIYKIIEESDSFTMMMDGLIDYHQDCLEGLATYNHYCIEVMGGNTVHTLNKEDSKLNFLSQIKNVENWLDWEDDLQVFYNIIRQTPYNDDFIQYCFSKASLLEDFPKELIVFSLKKILTVSQQKVKERKICDKIKWNGTHQELCVYWGYAGSNDLIEMEQDNENKIINWEKLSEHFVVLNKKTKEYEELPKDYKSKYSNLIKELEEAKPSELKKPRAIKKLLTEITEVNCQS